MWRARTRAACSTSGTWSLRWETERVSTCPLEWRRHCRLWNRARSPCSPSDPSKFTLGLQSICTVKSDKSHIYSVLRLVRLLIHHEQARTPLWVQQICFVFLCHFANSAFSWCAFRYGFGNAGKPKFDIPPGATLQYKIRLTAFEKVWWNIHTSTNDTFSASEIKLGVSGLCRAPVWWNDWQAMKCNK